ncbi:macrophage mannose receptor 1-like [Cloeon dipterum]|uniref:macrophage mannose receptor 1-like n=1 Tax=Cloeon dipterum TaxID=197152 RepID=UPI0032204065
MCRTATGATCPTCPISPSCNTKAESFNASSGQSLNMAIRGNFRNGCNKTYFFSSESAKFEEAQSKCCSLGMRILSVESKDELNCISRVRKEKTDDYDFYWTSGRLSSDCSQSVAWCVTGRVADKDPLWKKTGSTNQYGDCVVLKLYGASTESNQLSGLDRMACDKRMSFICEPRAVKHALQDVARSKQGGCSQPVCPVITCKRGNYFDSIGRLNLPESLGSLQIIKGQMYAISKVKKTFKEAAEACCSIDMRLISIENKAKGNMLEDYLEINEQYWTSGSDLGCEGKFGWCSQGGVEFGDNIPWLYNEPNNGDGNENCVNIDIIAWDSVKFKLNDNNCDKKMKFICESKVMDINPRVTTLAPPVVPTIAHCTKGVCPVHDCNTKSDLEVSFDDMEFVNLTFGVPRKACGKTFYFSKNRTTFANAGRACECSMKLKPISIETDADIKCFTDVVRQEYRKKNATLWTSGSDEMCPGKYTWCNTDKLMAPGAKWRIGEPSKSNWMQACIAIHIGNNMDELNGLADYKCTRKFRFVCELINT